MKNNNPISFAEQANNKLSDNHEEVQQQGYFYKGDSLYLAMEGKNPILVSESYIKVVALIRTSESKEWKKQIEFMDMDGKKQTVSTPQETMLEQKEVFKLLASCGFNINCNRLELMKYLTASLPADRITLIKRTGWLDNKQYICPSFQAKNPDSKESFLLAGNMNEFGFEIQGALEDWKDHICKLCEGNSVPTLALCHSFISPLLKWFPEIGTTSINLVGSSSIGKTSILLIAASTWGKPKKFMKQWRATANALEAVAESHNDCLLILDELSQISGKSAGEVIYTLSNEKGKQRLNADSEMKRCRGWRISVLSSGEVGIEDKLREDNGTTKAGQLVRFIDIDVNMSEHGVYEVLPDGFSSGAELSNHLKEKTSLFYGIAAKEFVSKLAKSASAEKFEGDKLVTKGLEMFPRAKYTNESPSSISAIRNIYQSSRGILYNKFDLSSSDGQVQRVADVFALNCTAGKLACKFGILTHAEKQIEDAIHTVFERWLFARGGKKSIEEQKAIEYLMAFLVQNESNFRKTEARKRDDGSEYEGLPENRIINNCFGHMKLHQDKTVYCILPKIFSKEVCKDIGVKNMRNILRRKNILETYSDGKDKQVLFEKGWCRMVVITVKKSSMQD